MLRASMASADGSDSTSMVCKQRRSWRGVRPFLGKRRHECVQSSRHDRCWSVARELGRPSPTPRGCATGPGSVRGSRQPRAQPTCELTQAPSALTLERNAHRLDQMPITRGGALSSTEDRSDCVLRAPARVARAWSLRGATRGSCAALARPARQACPRGRTAATIRPRLRQIHLRQVLAQASRAPCRAPPVGVLRRKVASSRPTSGRRREQGGRLAAFHQPARGAMTRRATRSLSVSRKVSPGSRATKPGSRSAFARWRTNSNC